MKAIDSLCVVCSSGFGLVEEEEEEMRSLSLDSSRWNPIIMVCRVKSIDAIRRIGFITNTRATANTDRSSFLLRRTTSTSFLTPNQRRSTSTRVNVRYSRVKRIFTMPFPFRILNISLSRKTRPISTVHPCWKRSRLSASTRPTNEVFFQTEFQFDQVFGSDATNRFVFEQTVQPFLSVRKRQNLTYICFGQTGSGSFSFRCRRNGFLHRFSLFWRKKSHDLRQSKYWWFTRLLYAIASARTDFA